MRTPQLYYNDKLRVSDRELIQYLNSGSYNEYRVTWIGDPTANWLVTKGNVGKKSYDNKNQAIKAARRFAKNDRPSLLIVERKKQSKFGQSGVSDWYSYER